MDLDDIDRDILKHLMIDARQSARQLALNLNISTVTVIARIKKLENAKVIHGYTATIDHEQLGYQLTAVIEVTVKKDVVKVESQLSKMENVCGVYDVTGPTDIMLVAKFKGRDQLSSFVKGLVAMPHVENTVTHLALNTVKEDFRLE